jgi:hypothetical protein
MMENLSTVDLVDLWPYWSQLPTTGRVAIPRGPTNNTDLCKPWKPDSPFCQEPGPRGGRRIDFIFVEQPREDHAYTVDFSRIRRRGDLFNGSKLADHLGLDITLIVAPRVHTPA